MTPTGKPVDEFENPAVSWEKAFEPKPCTDNRYHTKELVIAYNHEPRDAEEVEKLRVQYYMHYEDFNLCWNGKCRRPIKTVKAAVYPPQRCVRCDEHVTKCECENLRKLEQVPQLKRKKNVVGGMELEWQHYHASKPENNQEYGDILSHFEYRISAKTGKMFYVYVDGTDRVIKVKRIPRKVLVKAKSRFDKKYNADENGMVFNTVWKEVFVHIKPDGTETEIIPETSYRRHQPQCKCEFRKKRERKA